MENDWQPPKSHPLIPVAGVDRLNEVFRSLNEVLHHVLVEGRDWGLIPGAKSPSLGKPGAERLMEAYGLAPTYEVLAQEQDHDAVVEYEKDVWENGTKRRKSGTSRGIYSFTIRCTLTERGRQMVVGQGLGFCSSLEAKYVDRPRELGNTLIRMAMKRALVGAVSEALNLSSEFTGSLDGSVRVASMGKPLAGRTQERPSPPSPTPSPAREAGPASPPPPSPAPVALRIDEASGVPFRKVKDGAELVAWQREDTGQLLRVCPNCQSPMLELPVDSSMYRCVKRDCDTYEDGGRVPPPREGMSSEGLRPRDIEGEKRRAAEAAELATYAAKWERRRDELAWYEWQVEAVVLYLRMKEDWNTWGPRDYAALLEHLARGAQETLVKAIAQQAKAVPLIPERADKLRVLSSGKGVPISVMAEVETAIASGWNDPVTELIDVLEGTAAQPGLL